MISLVFAPGGIAANRPSPLGLVGQGVAPHPEMMHCNIMTQVPRRTLWGSRWRQPSAPATLPSNRIELGTVLAVEWRKIHQLNGRLAYERMVNTLGAVPLLLSCRSREDFYAARAAVLAEDLELVRDACQQAAQIVADGAGDAVRTISPKGS